MDEGHLAPYLAAVRQQRVAQRLSVARENIVVKNGRVRTGYRIGELLFGGDSASARPRAVVHNTAGALTATSHRLSRAVNWWPEQAP